MKNGCPNQASKQLKPNGQTERMVKMTKKDQGERGMEGFNTQISILLLCFLYLFVEPMITMNE